MRLGRTGWLFLWLAPFACAGDEGVARLRSQLSIEYARAGQYGQARDMAQKAVAAAPEEAAGWRALAYAERLLGRTAEAEAAFVEALRLAPDDADANHNYGLLLCETGHEERSLGFFSKALANPLYNMRHVTLTHLGRCSMKLGQWQEGERHLLSALKVRAQHVPAMRELVDVYLQREDQVEATRWMNRLLRQVVTAGPVEQALGARLELLSRDRVRGTAVQH